MLVRKKLYPIVFILINDKIILIFNMRKKYIYEIENYHKNDNNC